jgi:hypothetical protein
MNIRSVFINIYWDGHDAASKIDNNISTDPALSIFSIQ